MTSTTDTQTIKTKHNDIREINLNPGESINLRVTMRIWRRNPERKWWQIWKSLGYWDDLTKEELEEINKR